MRCLMEEWCENCKFWMPYQGVFDKEPRKDEGYCKRHAPQPRIATLDECDDRGVDYTWWPVTSDGEWCGEFKPKE